MNLKFAIDRKGAIKLIAPLVIVFMFIFLDGRYQNLNDKVKELKTENESLNAFVSDLQKKVETINRFPLPEEIYFCGERVPIEKWWVKRKLVETIRFYAGFKTNRQKLNTCFDLAFIYFPPLEKIIEQDTLLHRDLLYVPIAESFLDNEAVSKKGAMGAWQIMPSAAKEFNLEISRHIDERKDFFKAGEAMLQKLKKEYENFHDWPLTLAAYNVGVARTKEVIEEQGDSSFYNLILNSETAYYPFNMIAIKVIRENPEWYGFERPAYEGIEIWVVDYAVKKKENGSNWSLVEISKEFGLSPLEFKLLNPQFVGTEIPPGKYQIKTSKKPEGANKNPFVSKLPRY